MIDTSGSMRGEPIESVKVGIESMIAGLRQDPYALETACISIITYDSEARVELPLTPLDELQLPEMAVPESGATMMGAALELLCRQVDSEVRLSTPERKGDWMPLLFLMTDGKPSDLSAFNRAVVQVKQKHFASIVACAAGMQAKVEYLQKLTDKVFSLDTLDGNTFKQFFQWVTGIIQEGNRSIGATDEMVLPPPPDEVNLIV